MQLMFLAERFLNDELQVAAVLVM